MLKAIAIVAVVVYLIGVGINVLDIIFRHETITSCVTKNKNYQIFVARHGEFWATVAFSIAFTVFTLLWPVYYLKDRICRPHDHKLN